MGRQLFKNKDDFQEAYESKYELEHKKKKSTLGKQMAKFKWPKFLTVKRTIIFAILIAILLYVGIYFLGGYRPNPIEEDMCDFDETGFVEFGTYLDEKLEVVKVHNDEYKADLNSMDDTELYENIETLIENAKTKSDEDALKARITKSTVIPQTEKAGYTKLINTATDEEYAKQLLDVFEKSFETDNFVFYFNVRTTQFKIDSVERDSSGTVTKVLNTWYSNPQNDGVDPNSRGGAATIKLQKSPLIVSYLTRSGSVNSLTAYEYSISDTVGSGNDAESVIPSFEIKLNEEEKTLQVYYTFEKKGIQYTDFPKYVSDARFDELVERSNKHVEDLIADLTDLYKDNNVKGLQDYVDQHKSVLMIKNYLASAADMYDFVGLISLNSLVIDEDLSLPTATSETYLALISEMEHGDIELLYKLACEMVRVEYQYEYKTSSLPKKFIDRDYFKQAYDVACDQEVADNNGFGANGPYRQCGDYSTMKKIMRNNLYQILYIRLQYTIDDLIQDQADFNVEEESENSSYSVCVEYKLTNNGLTVSILTDSIKESDLVNYPICKVDILPYFTSQICEIEYDSEKYTTSGNIIIPDGSGAVIGLNNGKVDYSQYQKKIYSTDLAFGSQTKVVEQKDILLPMYAITSDKIMDSSNTNVVSNGFAIISHITKGAAQGTINANISMNVDSYNKAYFSFGLRESQAVKIGTGYYAKDITKFTEFYGKTDFVVDYNIYNVTDESGNYTYSDVAKKYQEMLINDGILSKENADTTDNTVVNVQLLGIYNYTDNFLGIVYNGHDTLTTFNQATTIMKTLKDWGAEDINLLYLGWRKSGLVNESFKNMKFGKKLGSKSEYKEMIDYLNKENINFYPQTSFLEINKYQDSLGKNRYSTRDISSEYTKKYPYDLAGNIYDTKKDAIYTLSPKFFEKFATILAENFKYNYPELNGMAFPKLGGNIVGDYKKHSQYYRFNSINEQIKAFEVMQEKGIENFSLVAPYEFAVKYATNITELPYESTLREIFDYSIPFYQLVFSGYKDYSGLIINANDEKSVTAHLMDILATGSNVEFTFTYDNSSELIQTDYNYYYYTQYSQWENEVTTILNELAKYKLHEYVLLEHEIYDGNSSIFVVTYANKADMLANGTTADTFKVYLNYSDKAVENVTTSSGNVTIDRWNYYVDKEA